MHKSKLNEFCQKRGWGTPKYSCIREGLDHSPLFKASVFINGASFSSQSTFKSTKWAHNDAAELALSQLTAPGELGNTGEVCVPVYTPEDKAETTTSSPNQATVSIKEPIPEKTMASYLLCNKVRVYTSIPDMVLPKGSVMLPIGEGKWTVACLES